MISCTTQLEKINDLIEWYLNSFEKARIALYVFPLELSRKAASVHI